MYVLFFTICVVTVTANGTDIDGIILVQKQFPPLIKAN